MILPFEEAKKRVIDYARTQPLNKQDWHFVIFDEKVNQWTDFYYHLKGFLTKHSGVADDFKMSTVPDLFVELGIIDDRVKQTALKMSDDNSTNFDEQTWHWFDALSQIEAMQNAGLDDEDIDITNI